MIEIFENKLFNKEDNKYIIIVILLIIGISIVVLWGSLKANDNGFVINSIEILENLKKDEIGVYIDGEVNKSGYIYIPKGSTLEDAINKAEGITKNADIQNIDLGRILKNEEKIIVPAIKEELDVKNEVEKNQISNNTNLININTATIDELKKLEGIGEKTAKKIIEYREENEFDNIEELMEIKGIGEGKLEKIKENICV